MFDKNYSIKRGYKIRSKNAPYIDDQPTGIVYQPDIYEFVKFLSKKGGFKYLIDVGAGNGEKLTSIADHVKIIAIDYDPNIKVLKNNLPSANIINFNLEKGLPKVPNEILKEAVVISADVIEHIVKPHQYLKGLAKWSKIAPYVLISTPDRTRARGPENFGPPANPFHVREWSIDELYSVLKNYGIPCRIGHSISNDTDKFKGTSVAIFGVEAMPKITEELKSLLTIVTVYNEEDFIEQSLKHLLNQGSHIHVIENWSTDNSLKVIKNLARKHKGLTYERFPKKKQATDRYDWTKILTRIEEVAAASNHDWILHNDADEVRISPWKNVTLQQAITSIENLGYNAIDFTVADFRPTRDGYDGTLPPDDFFHNFEFTKLSGYFVQIKGWKNIGKVQLASSGGHHAVFNKQKVFPYKFITKHYPLRSQEQANKKIFKDRIGRFMESETNKGWHIQYKDYQRNDKFIWDEQKLNKYTPDYFFSEYLIELLSGVGINRESEK
jgi:glycosyltransferase involved in cell wall biosynthesis